MLRPRGGRDHEVGARPHTARGGPQGIAVHSSLRLMPAPRWLLPVLVALVCAGAALRWSHTLAIGYRTPDERTYVAQARTLREEGVDGMRERVQRYLNDSVERLYPPPTRIGHIALVAASMRASGWTDARAGSLFSTLASVASLAVVAVECAQLFSPTVAVASVAAFALFPPELTVALRAWGDAPMGLIGVLLLVLALPLARGQWHPVRLAAFALVGALGVVLKESAPLMFGLCTLAVLVPLMRVRDWRRAALLLAVTGAAVIAGIAVLAWGAGGLGTFASVMIGWQRANAANTYALTMQTGPGYLLFYGFWVVAPVLTLLAGVGVVALALARSSAARIALLGSESAWSAAVGMSAVTAGFLAAPMLLAHWLNLRYVSVVFAPLAVLAGIGVAALVDWLAPRVGMPVPLRRIALAVLLLAALAIDYRRFHSDFVTGPQLADLSNGFLQSLAESR